jgi:hypothetical protein
MKRICLTFITIITISFSSYSQTNIFPANGNVGIGTTTPAYLFTISGPGTAINVTGNGTFNNNVAVAGSLNRIGNFAGSQATSGGIGLTLSAATYTDLGSPTGSTIPANAYLGIDIPTFAASHTSVTYTNAYNLYINGAPSAGANVHITNPYAVYVRTGTAYFGGNLLIGTPPQTNSSYLLNVGGMIRVNEYVVNTTGADFVFDPDYNLCPLPELKDYLTANHRLPGMASAKEMQSEGLNVGETETKLLQKVEDLTLYLIQNDEKQKQHQAQLKKDQEEIDAMKNQLNHLLKNTKKESAAN